MKTFITAFVLSGAIVFAVCVAHAAPASESRMLLQSVDNMAVSMADTADRLNLGASRTNHADAEAEQLNMLREDINQIGHELSSLENLEGTLPDWERKTLDQIVPIMQEMAATTDKAIQNFDTNRNHVWATGLPEQAVTISQDAERVKEIVHANLKLASVRAQEQRLESTVNGF
jgi:hypothetical protein